MLLPAFRIIPFEAFASLLTHYMKQNGCFLVFIPIV